MTTGDRVAAPCPACAPDTDTPHEVLKESTLLTVRCGDCGHVHKIDAPDDAFVTRDVIVSQDGDSFPATVDAPPDETVAVGEEFVLDTDDALMLVRITSLETAPEHRVEEALVEDVSTFWTRVVGNVTVPVTVHPNDGRHDSTRSLDVQLPGDYKLEIDGEETLGDETVKIEGVAVREDATGYPTKKLDRPGDIVYAKDAKRVYARDKRTRAWSAW